MELQGKYNSCKVFTDNVDDVTISQVLTLLNQPSMKDTNIRIMPDCHAGAGCVIGTTIALSDKVIPNLVGVDISCGMCVVQLQETTIDLPKLDAVIRQYVPSGANIHDEIIAHAPIDDMFAPIDKDRALRSLGTLGGGNHFIEIDRDDIGNLYLVIHTGSRHLGVEICNYYQNLAYERLLNNAHGGSLSELSQQLITKYKQEGREKELSGALSALKSSYQHHHIAVSKDLAYLEGEDFSHYLHDMALAQEYAKINRATIAHQILTHMQLHEVDRFETLHNYIDMEDMMLRKGAVSAKEGEKLLIPMNMRDGSLLCVGKGNPDWNYSAPHGAGRIMSRAKAKQQVSLTAYQDAMKHVFSTCVGEETLDESPMVYKPMDEIIANIQDTVEIQSIIQPIYNYKDQGLIRVLESEKHEEEELER